MEDEVNKGGLWRAVAQAAREWASTPFPYFLGLAFLLAALRWDGSFFDRKGCYQLQELNGVVYKVDSCAGKVERVEQPSPTKKADAKPPVQVFPESSAPAPDTR